jgi:tRNA dimethylallyltransferase
MFAGGLVEETRDLLDRGLAGSLASLRAIGYDEAMALLAGRTSRSEAEARTNLRTAQLAKRQRTWFRHQTDAVTLDGEGEVPILLERALAAITEARRDA